MKHTNSARQKSRAGIIFKRLTVFLLACVTVLTSLPGLAASGARNTSDISNSFNTLNTLSASSTSNTSDASNTPKEEVVYVNLNADGSLKEINVVNIFELSEDGRITDYGSYTALRNMTTTDEINYSSDTVTVDAKAGKLYYEGKVKDSVIPWNIGVTYFANGKEVPAEKICKMSGALRIHISVTENTSCPGDFFDSYALQLSMTFDTEKCRGITANGATTANVGRDKQITYTVLPGLGLDADITADVTDFETEGISVNGIPLNLNIDVDDDELSARVAGLLGALDALDKGAGSIRDSLSELKDKSESSLKSGVDGLYEGALGLYDGAAALKGGGDEVLRGAAALQSGAASLDGGIGELDGGISEIKDALDTLNSKSAELREGSSAFKAALGELDSALDGISGMSFDLSVLTNASAQIKNGIGEIAASAKELKDTVTFDGYKAAMLQNGLDIDALKLKNADAASSIRALTDSLNAEIEALRQTGADTSELSARAAQLENIASLLDANNAAIDGTKSYLDAVNQNLSALSSGAASLRSGYMLFDSAIGILVNTLSDLAVKAAALAEAVNTLVSEYEKLDGGINAYTDGVAEIVAGYSKVSSGVTELASGSAELKNGSDTLYGGSAELVAGIAELYSGTDALKDGAGALCDGTSELLDGISRLYDGSRELKDGTSSLKSAGDEAETEIVDKAGELLAAISGGAGETKSFVSERNTNVKSVQFVIRTEGIAAKEETPPAAEVKAELTWWQKLLRLFGLYD